MLRHFKMGTILVTNHVGSWNWNQKIFSHLVP